MKQSKPLYLLLLAVLLYFNSHSQDTLITQIAKNNFTLLSPEQSSFTGAGWDTLLQQIKQSDFVLIGEDHFTNEIPAFFKAITTKVKFDNFFCEIDPYSAKIIQNKIASLPKEKLSKYVAQYGNTFSFYALDPEFQLMTQLVKSNTAIYGLDQILLIADRLVCSELKHTTKNAQASKIYDSIEINSKIYFDNFLKDPNKPFYFLTHDFEKNLAALEVLPLSQQEKDVIASFKKSVQIYKEQSHHLRVQLMKNQLMKNYTALVDKKNLFKFGANHMPKGESLLKIYDMGNLVNNIADSKFKKSLHIMIVGKAGMQASPFKGFPDNKVDENSDDLKVLKPLFPLVTGKDWHCFEMLPLRKAMAEKQINCTDKLGQIINRYDYLVIIPEVTAAKFPSGG